MTKPDRAARLWLAVAVTTLWLLSVGGEAEETIPVSTVPDVTAQSPGSRGRGVPPACGWSVSFAGAGT